MQILLANPRGFCAGVNMAVDALDLAVGRFGGDADDPTKRPGEGIYVYHEIVHNRAVVDRFTDLGVTFVDHVEEVPEGGVLMYSAHGVSPAIREAAKDPQAVHDRRHLPARHEGPRRGDPLRARPAITSS